MDLHAAVIAVLNDEVSRKSDPDLDMTPADWKVAKELVKVLKPVEETTTFWSGESYVTISSILPMAQALKDNVQPSPGDSQAIKKVKMVFLAQLKDRFQIDSHSLPVQAALMDPWFKHLPFLSAREKQTATSFAKE